MKGGLEPVQHAVAKSSVVGCDGKLQLKLHYDVFENDVVVEFGLGR